jgi:uncharacterized membrane protein YbaN (DUF454 family)
VELASLHVSIQALEVVASSEASHAYDLYAEVCNPEEGYDGVLSCDSMLPFPRNLADRCLLWGSLSLADCVSDLWRRSLTPMAMATTKVARTLFLMLGLFMTAIAFAGIVIPGLPSTGPILLAGYAFSKSSEKFDRWLLNHRLFGPVVRSWRLHRGFTKRVKQFSLAGITATFGLSLYLTNWPTVANVVFVAFAVLLSAWIWARPTVAASDREVLMSLTYEDLAV